MKIRKIFFLMLLTFGLSGNFLWANDQTLQVAKILDMLHTAAAEHDAEAYFNCFAEDAVYFGTDATERWDLAAFKKWVEPYFNAGKGWTYTPTKRSIYFPEDADNVAWFDEALDNQHFGECRSTGVLKKVKGEWKISQYNLTLPIPNELMKTVVKLIKEQGVRENSL